MDIWRDPRTEVAYAWVVRYRAGLRVLADAMTWVASLVAATFFRYDLSVGRITWGHLLACIPIALFFQFVFGWLSGVYSGWWRFASLEEVAAVGWTAAVAGGSLAAIDSFARPRLVPLGAALVSGPLALVGMALVRMVWRALWAGRQRPDPSVATNRLVVYGAGEGGHQVLRSLLGDPRSTYYPVALIDDDPRKRNLQLMGIRVFGNGDRLAEVAERLGASTVLLAIPSASGELVRRVQARADAAGLTLKVLPTVEELYGDRVGAGDIRDPSPEDLLGRRPIQTDLSSIADYVTGRRVLVTGAGGSIGSELCRQLSAFGPGELMMLDRDESGLHATQLSVEGRAMLDSDSLILADIRDRQTIRDIFLDRQPDVVFHAAALKHLTLLERHPLEALRTNVWGTRNVLEAAIESGVSRFINISTDKAAAPVSVLGYSKRVAERLAAAAGGATTGVSVRFGNVLGSRGSVLTAFRAQAAAGHALTVTHPEATRYFMTVSEAVELVIQAGAIGRSGEVLVLDMGQPVSILEVAERIAAQADPPVGIEFSGLRPGEKLHEELFDAGDTAARPFHPLISHVAVEPLAAAAADDLVLPAPAGEVVGMLRRLAQPGLEAEAEEPAIRSG